VIEAHQCQQHDELKVTEIVAASHDIE